MTAVAPAPEPKKKSVEDEDPQFNLSGFTSLFPKKLISPLGFYREVDRYCELKRKFKDDPEKLEALEELWEDYQKYQIRQRFRWPPKLFCRKMLFFSTGYYGDILEEYKATRLNKPGHDSSDDDELGHLHGTYLIAGIGGDDIDLKEYDRYRHAKKNKKETRKTEKSRLLEVKDTIVKLFGTYGKDGKSVAK